MSWLLRHGANEAGLAMDAAGWADVGAVLALTGLDRAALEQAVRVNDKGRYEIDGQRVRACQGHSTAGTPVTADALEATWRAVPATEIARAFHGTNVDAARAILAPASEGIVPVARTHVHLADAPDAKVGKRASVDVLLAVDIEKLGARGIALFRAPNGVLLARRVPKDAIVDVVAQTKGGERALEQLRALLSPRSATSPRGS